MREISFRGKSVSNNEWVEGFYEFSYMYDSLRECHRIILADKPTRTNYLSEVIPETVGQYTGLTDKNGKKIFEGDILKGILILHPDRQTFEVVYENNGFYFRDEDEEGWHPDHIDDYEVIGNTHDNPELLKYESEGEG